MFWGLYGSKTKKRVFRTSQKGPKRPFPDFWFCGQVQFPVLKTQRKFLKKFFLKELLESFNPAIFWTRKTIWALRNQYRSQKSRIFWVKTCTTPPRLPNCVIYHFPGHFRPYYGNLNFLAKIVILAIFDIWHHSRQYGREWPEMWLVTRNEFSDPLGTVK